MAGPAQDALGLRLRRATEADVPPMVDIHARSVRESCIGSYTSEQIEAWLAKPRPEAFAERVRDGRVYVCCDDEGRVLGFGEGNGDTVSALYVDPSRQRRGIGGLLLHQIESDALEEDEGVAEMRVHSTLNAVRFYERHGFEAVRIVDCPVTHELPLAALAMRKRLL